MFRGKSKPNSKHEKTEHSLEYNINGVNSFANRESLSVEKLPEA
jgi:hypothetical protein